MVYVLCRVRVENKIWIRHNNQLKLHDACVSRTVSPEPNGPFVQPQATSIMPGGSKNVELDGPITSGDPSITGSSGANRQIGKSALWLLGVCGPPSHTPPMHVATPP